MENNTGKIIGGFVIIVLLVVGGVLSVSLLGKSVGDIFNTSQEEGELESDYDEGETVKNIETAQKIEGQKINNINDKEIELDNGVKFNVEDSSKITCKVGDTISSYDEDKKGLVCEGENPDTKQVETRYIYVDQPTNTGNNLLTNLILFDYFTSRNYLRNNGYTYNRTTNVYQSPSGSEYTVNRQQPSNNNTTKTVIQRTKAPSTTTGGKTNTPSVKATAPSGHGGGIGGGSGSGGS